MSPDADAVLAHRLIGLLDLTNLESNCGPAEIKALTARALGPPASVAALAAALPQATPLELADCGHWTMLEQAAAVVAAMRDFYAA